MKLLVILCCHHGVGNPPMFTSPNMSIGISAGLLLLCAVGWHLFFKKSCE